ncbi:MAG TPA: carbamoyltransferase C-terminal domain-containing protein [Pyrinomonadaceae bacterium]|nr:carbamoyltransferase C-terminal domain-containing protein [Pyrinomonadaceae bacterium]
MTNLYILGINAYHGDAAAALIKDGVLIAAVEEERFNRIKHCAGFPTQAIQHCLRTAGIGIDQVEHVGISRNPGAHLHKKILAGARRLINHQHAAVQHQPASAIAAAVGGRSGSGVAFPNEDALLSNSNGNGYQKASTGRLADRLRNAATVFDLKSELARALAVSEKQITARTHRVEHHRAHLASAFFVSPFDRAALLSLDGFGDFVSTMWAIGAGKSIKVLGQVEYPHSLGILYTATTQFLGFPHYGDEGKVMGLAPYGKPRFIDEFREIVTTEAGGKFRLNLDYFLHSTQGVEMSWDGGSPRVGRIFSNAFEESFGPARAARSTLTERDRDLAASLQLRLEEVAFHILNHLHAQTSLTDLGLAGGVAYNSVMNGKILRQTPFERVFVQPAAGDSGTAIGVCYQIWNEQSAKREEQRAKSEGRRAKGKAPSAALLTDESSLVSAVDLSHLAPSSSLSALCSYPGPEFSPEQIKEELEISSLKFQEYSKTELIEHAARDIADGLVVGWFQGRMEFGPRALGNRSILADPRRADMKDVLNERIKKREPFRPFAPSILEEHVGDYFEQTHPSPAMLMVYEVKPDRRGEIPAVTHVDGTGRLQTVTRSSNERFCDLIEQFYKLTGIPIVLNTSFNENEPIVCTPRDAIDCFLKSRIDALYLGNCAVRR